MEARPVLLSPATCLYTHQYPDVHSSYWMAMKILHLLFKLFCISLFVYQVELSQQIIAEDMKIYGELLTTAFSSLTLTNSAFTLKNLIKHFEL